MTQPEEIVERYTDKEGTEWVRVWRPTLPGMQQLVWERLQNNPEARA